MIQFSKKNHLNLNSESFFYNNDYRYVLIHHQFGYITSHGKIDILCS